CSARPAPPSCTRSTMARRLHDWPTCSTSHRHQPVDTPPCCVMPGSSPLTVMAQQYSTPLRRWAPDSSNTQLESSWVFEDWIPHIQADHGGSGGPVTRRPGTWHVAKDMHPVDPVVGAAAAVLGLVEREVGAMGSGRHGHQLRPTRASKVEEV